MSGTVTPGRGGGPRVTRARRRVPVTALAVLALLTLGASAAQAAYPGQNGRIAFTREQPGGGTQIYSINPDGTDERPLTTIGTNNHDPEWSPDGSRIAFTSDRDGNSEIYVMNADGSEQRRLTRNPAADEHPEWSPDGLQILFESNRNNADQPGLVVIGADGANERDLSEGSGSELSPAWAPNSSLVVYRSIERDGSTGALRLSVRAFAPGSPFVTRREVPTDPEKTHFGLEWTPDSARVAFWEWPSTQQVWTMSSAGGDETLLADDARDPAWSPDGTRVAVVSRRSGNYEIYTMSAQGADFVRLTFNTATDATPSWQPLPGTTPPPVSTVPGPAGGAPVDADGDGFTREQGDCNDASAAIGPTAREILGNFVDEDCDERPEPYPVVEAGVNLFLAPDGRRRRVRVTGLRVVDLRGRETIAVSCRGRCAKKLTVKRDVPASARAVALTRRVRGGWVAFGSTLVVRIERAGYSAKTRTWRIRRKASVTTRTCELPDNRGRDADCDGFEDLPLVTATARLDTARRGRQTLLRGLRISRLRGDERVTSSCRGGGCTPALGATVTVGEGVERLRLDGRVAGVRLRAGARLDLAIARAGFVTRVYRWTMRAKRAPRKQRLCLGPSDRRPVACRR